MPDQRIEMLMNPAKNAERFTGAVKNPTNKQLSGKDQNGRYNCAKPAVDVMMSILGINQRRALRRAALDI